MHKLGNGSEDRDGAMTLGCMVFGGASQMEELACFGDGMGILRVGNGSGFEGFEIGFCWEKVN